MKNILIIGDSFAADWSVKFTEYKGWPNLLSEKFNVTNLAQAGVSEYKIFKQLESIEINDFDIIIVSHTSPYRVPTVEHPVHNNDVLHHSADLMLNDLLYHNKKLKNIFNFKLKSALGFFKYHYNVEFYETTYGLYRKAIENKLSNTNLIVLNFFADSKYPCTLNFVEIAKLYAGVINHMSASGNEIVFQHIIDKINSF